MTKVLLVEDDNNLREIFEMRLQADGYQTVTAGNGEEGLTIAMQEKPDLIVADVMMPKLSGFDMLESLRSAPELKDTKVIMMTALGQAEDQERGQKLGVLKYLVKSQATLEDFAKVIKDVLPPDGGTPGADTKQANDQNSNQQESENKMQDDQTATPAPTNDMPAPAADAPAAPASNPVMGDASAPAPAADNGQMTTAQEQTEVQDQMNSFAGSMGTDAPAADAPAAPAEPAAPAADMSQPSSNFAPTTPPVADTTTPYDQPAATTDAASGSTDPMAAAPAADAPAAPAEPAAPADTTNQTV